MIKCEDGIIKIEGQIKTIAADILCLFNAFTLLLKDDEIMRQAIVLSGEEEITGLLEVLTQAAEEVKSCTEN